MNLESSFNEILCLLLSNHDYPSLTAEQLIHVLDLTLLEEKADPGLLHALNHDATLNSVAAICVYYQHLPYFQQLSTIKLASVVNFPYADSGIKNSLTLIDKAIFAGVQEIDYVFPYAQYLNGQKQQALEETKSIINFCHHNQLTIKIIIETGAFPEMHSIYQAGLSLAELGANFLKTSTGKTTQGASLAAAFALLSAIKNSETNCGLKVSGGVKTSTQAFNYAKLAELILGKKLDKSWFRIGASSLLKELVSISKH